MSFSRLFPYALAVCFALCLLTPSAAAQTETRPRSVSDLGVTTTTTEGGRPRLENDIYIVSSAEESEAEPEEVFKAPSMVSNLAGVERLMQGAIEQRIGVPYRLGSEGPNRYDCSGFVWSAPVAGSPSSAVRRDTLDALEPWPIASISSSGRWSLNGRATSGTSPTSALLPPLPARACLLSLQRILYETLNRFRRVAPAPGQTFIAAASK